MALQVTSQNFDTEVLQSDKVVLVDFWAEWCGPCKILGPVIEEIAEEMKDSDAVKIAKLDVDENSDIAQQYGIQGIPTMKFFKNGEVVDEIIGLHPKEVIVNKLNELAET